MAGSFGLWRASCNEIILQFPEVPTIHKNPLVHEVHIILYHLHVDGADAWK